MKRFLKAVLLLLAFSIPFDALADGTGSVTFNGINYTLYYSGEGAGAEAEYVEVTWQPTNINGTADIASSITYEYTYTSDGNTYTRYLTAPVTKIRECAFYYCSWLTDVIIPNTITTIGQEAFYGCSRLTNIVIPSSVNSIGNLAFASCSSLISVAIPESVISIGNGTFSNCSSLTNLTIPSSVTSIGSHTFYGCSSLTSIIIPNSITSIGSNAFNGCSNLASITIPNTITTIGSSAFSGCSSLTSIVIPEKVTFIGAYAFGDCSSLTSITCLATNPPVLGYRLEFRGEDPVAANAISPPFDCYWGDYGPIIYVPASSVETYKSDYGDVDSSDNYNKYWEAVWEGGEYIIYGVGTFGWNYYYDRDRIQAISE